MDIFAVLAQKGGAGKTTLCISTAVAAARQGLATAIVDLDPQASATNWSDRRSAQEPVVVSAQPARLAHVLDAAREQGADLVVIDTAPRAEQGAMAAARAADLVILPCRPAIADLETIPTSVDLIRLAERTTQFLCVLNALPPQGPRELQARQVLADLDIPVCPVGIGYRAAIDHAAAAGQSAQEYEPRGKAAAEIGAVYSHIMKLVNSSTQKGPKRHAEAN